MDRTKTVAGLIAFLLLAGCSRAPQPLRVGSKNFTEQVVLGEIIAQHLEHRLGQKVERKLNLGGTLLAHQALLSGEIDLYPEYSGTALAAILKQPLDNDAAQVFERVRAEYARQFQLSWLDPLGINDTFVMVIRGADARAQHLETLSDASRSATAWALGVGYEFQSRPDGLAALDKSYGLRWSGSPKSMDLGLLYRAIEQKQVSMIAANATDGLLSKMDLKVLADDRRAFPPYEVSIAARQDRLSQVKGLRAALAELSGKFTNQRMRELNFQVDGRHHPLADVAAEFLRGIPALE